MLAKLNGEFNQELTAAQSYRALSLWCDDQNLKGFARYFGKQVGEEQGQERRERVGPIISDEGSESLRIC